MRVDYSVLWLALSTVAVACGSSGSGNVDGGVQDDGASAMSDARPVGACGDIATFEDGLSPSAQVHVAQNGDDSTGDGSSGNPYATIQRAANGLAPGFANNLWYAHDDPGASMPSLPTAETGGVVGSDPAFTSGVHIGSGSPAAGAGRAKTGFRGDFDGDCYATPPSIGAFEVP